jgi:hypothetical protein
LGVCLPEDGCGRHTDLGSCEGHVLLACKSGVLESVPCLQNGKVCKDGDGNTTASCCPVLAAPCDGLPSGGHCEGKNFFTCDDDSLGVKPCDLLGFKDCRRVSINQFGCAY